MSVNGDERNSYNVITLDFSVGYNKDHAKKKLKTSIDFFNNLSNNMFSRKENIRLNVHHIIFAPKETV